MNISEISHTSIYKKQSFGNNASKSSNSVETNKSQIGAKTLLSLSAALALGAVVLYKMSKGKSSQVLNIPASNNENNAPVSVISNEIVNKIKNLQGNVFERTNEIKNIFLKEMGYPSDLLKIEEKTAGSGTAGFCPFMGEINIKTREFEKISNGEIAGIIRHELDHMDKHIKLCKSMGIDEYKKFIIDHSNLSVECKKYASDIFNTNFYIQAMENTDIKNFDCELYRNALIEHYQAKLNDFSDYSCYFNYSKYRNNAFEKSAFDIERAIENSFGINNRNNDSIPKIFPQLDLDLEKCIKKHSEYGMDKSMLFDYFFEKAIIESDPTVKTTYNNMLANPNNSILKDEYVNILLDRKNKLGIGKGICEDELLLTKVFNQISKMTEKKLSESEIQEIFDRRDIVLQFSKYGAFIPT